MPACGLGVFDVGPPRIRPGHVDVFTNPVPRRHQVGVSVEAGVEERYGDALPSKVRGRAEAQAGGQDRRRVGNNMT